MFVRCGHAAATGQPSDTEIIHLCSGWPQLARCVLPEVLLRRFTDDALALLTDGGFHAIEASTSGGATNPLSTSAYFLMAITAIFATNLLPAFGPPTWALLVFFKFNGNLPIAPLVVLGAVASTSGRYLLARGSHHFRGRFSAERVEHLEDARTLLTGHRAAAAGGLGLFVLSPLPSAQLFVAAGLLGVALVPLSAAFLIGRVVSYSLYLGGATLAYDSIGETLTDTFTSTTGVTVQLALIAGVVMLVEVDWAGRLTSRLRPAPAKGTPEDDDGADEDRALPQNDGGRPEGRPPEPVA